MLFEARTSFSQLNPLEIGEYYGIRLGNFNFEIRTGIRKKKFIFGEITKILTVWKFWKYIETSQKSLPTGFFPPPWNQSWIVRLQSG